MPNFLHGAMLLTRVVRGASLSSSEPDNLSVCKLCFQRLNYLLVQAVSNPIGIRKTQVQDKMVRASLDESTHVIARRPHVAWIDHQLHRSLNGFWVAPDGGAMFI